MMWENAVARTIISVPPIRAANHAHRAIVQLTAHSAAGARRRASSSAQGSGIKPGGAGQADLMGSWLAAGHETLIRAQADFSDG
jgi:hypothetical protein